VERCKLPPASGVWSGATAEIELGAFLSLKYDTWSQQL